MKIYIDTSILGGYFDKEFKKHSIRLIEEIREGKKIAVLSDLTLKELSVAPDNVQKLIAKIPDKYIEFVFVDDEALVLADLYIKEGIVSKRFYADALHIAIATLNRVDVVVSWNFKHIVNLNRIRLYNSVNLKSGYQIIEIRSPMEVVNEKY